MKLLAVVTDAKSIQLDERGSRVGARTRHAAHGASRPGGWVSLAPTRNAHGLPRASLPPRRASRLMGRVSMPAGRASRLMGRASLPPGRVSLPAGRVSLPTARASRPLTRASLPPGRVSQLAGRASQPMGAASPAKLPVPAGPSYVRSAHGPSVAARGPSVAAHGHSVAARGHCVAAPGHCVWRNSARVAAHSVRRVDIQHGRHAATGNAYVDSTSADSVSKRPERIAARSVSMV